MVAARQAFDAGDLKTAKAQLSWVVAEGKHEVADIARLRLAAVLFDEKAFDEALKVLEASHAPAFASRFLDLKGDVLAAKGKGKQARQAYLAAKEKLSGKAAVSAELLQQKIDALGESA